MLYHLDFRVEYPATMSQKELFAIWSEEADAAINGKIEQQACLGLYRFHEAAKNYCAFFPFYPAHYLWIFQCFYSSFHVGRPQ